PMFNICGNHCEVQLPLFALLACLGVVLPGRAQPCVMHGSPEALRLDAISVALPEYPRAALEAGRKGLVVVEVTVLSKGVVGDLKFIESFDKQASDAVAAALKTWRFRSITEDPEVKNCVRQARLLFEFSIEGGKPRVIDLAAAEVDRRHLPRKA
ncbi:MAG: TonB family protein, partial [Bryobacteraceae bacterium]